MGPEALAQVLRPLADMFPAAKHPDVLRGLENPDDAAVYRVSDDLAVVLTADFFPPVVDDPYDFGAIAAANSLSDLYAMGARPLFGINLVGFPDDLDHAILTEILRGGGDTMRDAGAVVAGGHTTTDPEPKYGLAVLGVIHPDRVLSKGGARPGDVLLLTKPLGTGTITTAAKKDECERSELRGAVDSMARLNRGAAEILHDAGDLVHAMTDITGFALAGHGHEMAEQSGIALRLRYSDLPVLPGAERHARDGRVPGGGRRNAGFYGRFVTVTANLDDAREYLLYDPQTSGGLFAAVDPGAVDAIIQRFREADEPVWRVGEVTGGEGGTIEVV